MRPFFRGMVVAGALAAGLLAVCAPPTAAAEHEVRRGETLIGIARRYGTTVDDLVQRNSIENAHLVLVGTRLRVSGPPTAPALVPMAAPAATPAPAAAPAATPPTAAASGVTPRDEAALHVHARADLIPLFHAAAAEFGVRADLLMALAFTESRWVPDAVASTGATGVGQQLPQTVDWLRWRLGEPGLDALRAQDSIRMSAALLSVLVDETGSHRLGLAAYYQGLADLRRRGVSTIGARYAEMVLERQAWFTGL